MYLLRHIQENFEQRKLKEDSSSSVTCNFVINKSNDNNNNIEYTDQGNINYFICDTCKNDI